MRFFCSPKHNGNSGFAVNGDGLLHARELQFVRSKPISKTRTGVLTFGASSMTVDGSLCAMHLSATRTHCIPVLRGASDRVSRAMFGLAIS